MQLGKTKNTIAIFRETILPYSETFIAAQVKSMQQHVPIVLGFERKSNGVSLSAPVCVMTDYGAHLSIGKVLFRLMSWTPPRWRREVEKQKFKLVHAHFGPDALWIQPVVRRLNLPLVVTFHGYDVIPTQKPFNRSYKLYRRRRHKVYRRAQHIVAVSKFIHTKLVDDGCPPDHITTIHIGIDSNKFSPKETERERIVLYVGRLIKQKGALDLLKAAHSVFPKHGQARIVFIGSGPLEEQIRQEARQLSLRCDFLGSLTSDQVRFWMNRAWVLCMPSRHEAFGLVYAEAQAMELPVVAYNHSGVPEAVSHGVGGLLCPAGDINALCSNLDLILSSKQLRDQLGSSGREYICKNFNIDIQTQKLEELYKSVCNQSFKEVSKDQPSIFKRLRDVLIFLKLSYRRE